VLVLQLLFRPSLLRLHLRRLRLLLRACQQRRHPCCWHQLRH
ncbi:hypothetical protein BN1723_010058, partial [Verticillium longisporum]